MADAAEVAKASFDAWTGEDLDRVHGLLHDNVSYQDPVDTFSDADS